MRSKIEPGPRPAQGSRRHGGSLLHAFDQRGFAYIGPVGSRVGNGAAELLEILLARRRVLLVHALLVGNRLLLLLIGLLLRLEQELLGQHQQQHRDGKNKHHTFIDAGLILRILELAQGNMPICAAEAASLVFTI